MRELRGSMRELRVIVVGARSLGFILPHDVCVQHQVVLKDEVYYSERLEGGVHMHLANPTFGRLVVPPVSRRVSRTGRSLAVLIPHEFLERLGVHESGDRILAAPARDGLYLYPWTEERLEALSALTQLRRTQRELLYAMGA